jgi:hypothetical protein
MSKKADNEWRTAEQKTRYLLRTTTVVKEPFSIYKEPSLSAQSFDLAKGTKIVFPSTESYAFFPWTHKDMDDEYWLPIIDGNNKKLLGWLFSVGWGAYDNPYDKRN